MLQFEVFISGSELSVSIDSINCFFIKEKMMMMSFLQLLSPLGGNQRLQKIGNQKMPRRGCKRVVLFPIPYTHTDPSFNGYEDFRSNFMILKRNFSNKIAV